MIGTLKEQYEMSIRKDIQIVESSQPKEIRIVIGSKDQYVVEWP
jgi:hypothetical protein